MSTEGEIESFLSAHQRVFTPRFAEGDVIGDWRIVAFIARGGTAEVYRAECVADGQVAALKVLHKNDEVHRQRLAREAEFLRTHKHPAFPVLLDSRIAEGGPSYLAEEFLYPLGLPRKDGAVAQLMQKLCVAVGSLHCRGLVHRDLKPSNIMTRREGGMDPVIVDFGLLRAGASAAVPRADSLTIENGHPVGVGTPGYGAPEQFIGGEVSPSVDIHALGVIADRCFDGMPSSTWERIIRRATSSLPDLRYPSVASMARAVRRRHWMQRMVAAVLCLSLYFGLHMLLWGWFSDPGRYMGTPSSSSLTLDASKYDGLVLWVEKGADEYKADGSKRYPYRGLERALAAATNGMTIVVRPGEYMGGVTLTNEGVRLVSEKGPERTVLHGEPDCSVIRLSETSRRCEIRGFTLRGGKGTVSESERGKDFYGGGICVEGSEHLIVDCVLTMNGTGVFGFSGCSFGGGVCVRRGSMTLKNCEVRANCAWCCGAGIYLTDGSTAEIVDCTIAENFSNRRFDYLGGVGLDGDSSLKLVNSIVKDNYGDQLGAIAPPYNRGTSAEVVNCEISDGLDPHGIENFTMTPRTSSAPIGYCAP